MTRTALAQDLEFLFVYSFPLAFASMFLAAYGMVFAGRRRSLKLYGRVGPAWGPRPWLFGVAWLIAYSLAAVAFWRARTGEPTREINDSNVTWAVVSHVVTLAALAVWPWLFFFLKRIFLAFACVCLALGGAISTCIAFFMIDDLAGGLYVFVPVWIAYAAAMSLYVINYFTIEPRRRRYKNGIEVTEYRIVEKPVGAAILPMNGEGLPRNMGSVLVVGSTNAAVNLTSDDEDELLSSGEESGNDTD